MPTYPYQCSNDLCGHTFDVVKSLSEIDQPEHCDKCQATAERFIGNTSFYGASDWDKAEFNPGLGCVTRNGKHRREIAKSRGLEELGNDYSKPERMISESEKARERRYNDGWSRV
jgi:putative FmdB family regulatory protein